MSNITERKNFKILITGSFVLAVNAGFIGALSLAGLHSATVTHLTGDIAKTSIFLVRAEYFSCVRMTFVWLSFMLGSMISQMIVGQKPFELRRTYGWALLLESLCLFLGYLTSNREAAKTGWWISEYFTACGCGIQNALCTGYSGAVIRTTHMTGICTDIGISVGQEIRLRVVKPVKRRWRVWSTRIFQRYSVLEAPVSTIEGQVLPSPTSPSAQTPQEEPSLMWRLKILVPLLVGYILGAILGCVAYLAMGNSALCIPGIFIFIMGFLYVISTTLLMVYNKIKMVVPVPEIEMTEFMRKWGDPSRWLHKDSAHLANPAASEQAAIAKSNPIAPPIEQSTGPSRS